MKKFEIPSIEISDISVEDIITTSFDTNTTPDDEL